MTSAAWSFAEAEQKCKNAEVAQEQSEDKLRDVWRKYAIAEEKYRTELAVALLRLKAEGQPATTARDLARGQEKIAELKRLRDIAEGERDAVQTATWRHTANRKDARGFSAWAERREMAEGYGDLPEPDFDPATGEIRERQVA